MLLGGGKRGRVADGAQLVFAPTPMPGDIDFFTEVLNLQKFDMEEWATNLDLKDLEELYKVVEGNSRTGNMP